MTNINTPKSSLVALGVKGSVTCNSIGRNKLIVNLDGKYFGIWDNERNTFVD